MTEEENRLQLTKAGAEPWKLWGPYLSDRAWGTVREDYSADGSAWDYFPHDWARSKAYRWNEDGLLGICDDRQHLCFALALWNGNDPIVKERLFGLTGSQGNHGEDVKEYYYYIDSTPTHSYMKALYKYPQRAFPYADLVHENGRRSKLQPEYELIDTGIFNENRYFDVFVEYAKAGVDDILIKISVANRGPEAAELHVLPTLWYRNTWRWLNDYPCPAIAMGAEREDVGGTLQCDHPSLGAYSLFCQHLQNGPEFLFTNNETNNDRIYGCLNTNPYVKDGINNAIVHGEDLAVNPAKTGTKASAHYNLTVAAGATEVIHLRLTKDGDMTEPLGGAFDEIFEEREREANEFYATVIPPEITDDAKSVQRQALAGMLWSKQFYHYNVEHWLTGDPGEPTPPASRWKGRNCDWTHLNNSDVLSMPDAWEYPWYAAWDLAFHTVPLSLVDSEFAKEQLLTLCEVWYMHPNGQLPAYEWSFDDTNPPVHAYAAIRVFRIERRLTGVGDRQFLERIFHKLIMNFTWWVNRKDPEGRNVFQGGFLGLDNIAVFDRSAPLPEGQRLEQSDGTAWMGMFCLNMLAIALELAAEDDVYQDMAVKFFEHFLYIAAAMNNVAGEGISLWDEEDGFFYDTLRFADGTSQPLKVRSLVGLIPLLSVTTIEQKSLDNIPTFRKRFEWFLKNRPDMAALVPRMQVPGVADRRLLCLVGKQRMLSLLSYMLDPNEFLSDYGIRALSKHYKDHPYYLEIGGIPRSIDYEPAESTSGLFGGNSNWRGPIWFPTAYLLIEALQRFHYYYGDDFLVEFPTHSGNHLNLWQISQELSRRLIRIFLKDSNGHRPVFGPYTTFQTDPLWNSYIPFHEYFHGDTGQGLGASHQTGWTGLVAKLIQQSGE